MKKPEWYELTTTQNGNKFFIRTENVSKEGSIIKFWQKIEIKNKSLIINGKKIIYTNVKELIFTACDCDNKRYKFYKAIYYNTKGDVIQSVNDETDWENIIPETVMESISKKVCEISH